mmetsp:Transcript_9598/g.19891  ORF Transcript_9598/g.19891 Transcript_9598/m.19891 type:complete len:225 (-) Transcript_9598:1291-1965(-)
MQSTHRSSAILPPAPPPPPARAISRSMRSRLMGMFGSSIATAPSTSSAANAPACCSTCLVSSDLRRGTLRTTLKAAFTSSISITWMLEVVPKTRRRRPGGGGRLSSTSSVWRMALEKCGPMAAYSRRRSMSSRRITLSGDLNASSNTLWIICTLEPADMDTMASALTSLMKGKSDSSASVAASADLPAPGGPSSRHVSSGVCSEVRTCWMMERQVVMRCWKCGP